MHIRSVSYILDQSYQILSIADEFVEFHHVSGAPFLPAEVWGKEVWSNIQQNGLARTFQALFAKGRRRALCLPFRLDCEQQLALWQVQAEASGDNLLVAFHLLAQKQRPRLRSGETFVRPPLPLVFCGWCNRYSEPDGKPRWFNFEEAEYAAGLKLLSPSSVRLKLCDACTQGLIHSHEPKYFEHLALDSAFHNQEPVVTLHRVLAAG